MKERDKTGERNKKCRKVRKYREKRIVGGGIRKRREKKRIKKGGRKLRKWN